MNPHVPFARVTERPPVIWRGRGAKGPRIGIWTRWDHEEAVAEEPPAPAPALSAGEYALQKYGLESAQWPPQCPIDEDCPVA